MKAVIFQGENDVEVEDVDEPPIERPNDVIVDITTTAIYGSDLHMYEGWTGADPGMATVGRILITRGPNIQPDTNRIHDFSEV